VLKNSSSCAQKILPHLYLIFFLDIGQTGSGGITVAPVINIVSSNHKIEGTFNRE